ncbi:hypothetical protein GN244_ATG05834 [Phytophthora infestans]|uniref:Uncharacterized protein n=1 Tax=Phytophthora infestans TaxID=4787 RepID=A0A833T1D1_PHYIN|nr:hypothetical protein GN244_ATG05834 [Phytophthora infestans]KAF4137564.1 hypothetical protein GN958_ATG13246 [Phytophthora infestans]
MSATQALKNAAFGRSPAWPDSDTRPDLQTLRGRFLRRLHLSLLYGLWVVGIAFFIVMWVFSLFCVAQWVWSTLIGANEAPIPLAVQVFLSLVALYESFHFVTRPSHHPWPFMRRLIRYSLLHYPYFRLNATVFDERERATQSSQDGATNDYSDFSTEIQCTRSGRSTLITPFLICSSCVSS